MFKHIRFAVIAAVAVTAPVFATNVALNKPVSIVSGAGSVLPPPPSTGVVTDGAFLSEVTAYSAPSALSGSIRWNTALAGPTVIEIQFGDLYTIDGIIVQADDNDALLISYLNASNNFVPLYTVNSVSVGDGFRTRPNADQITFAALTPVDTAVIRVAGSGGDGFYAISELQLRGTIVPEPASLSILATSALLLRRRRAI